MIPGMYNGKHMLQSQQVLGEEMGMPKAMTMLEDGSSTRTRQCTGRIGEPGM